jgi:hypothetical protein
MNDDLELTGTTVACSASARVIVTSLGGDLAVEGWERDEVMVDVDPDELPTVDTEGDAVHVSAPDDAVVHVPHGASLEVASSPGDVAVTAVRGTIAIGTVGGDLALNDVGASRIGSVDGDLTAETVGGDFVVRSVGSDAAIRTVSGNLDAGRVGADLAVSGVTGDIRATAGADAALEIAPAEGRTYTVTAGASIRCHVPEDANLVVNVTSGAGAARIDVPGAVGEAMGGLYNGTLGTGGATLNLVAGARVVVRSGAGGSGDSEWGDMAADFGADLTDWADDLAGRMRVHAVRVADRVGERLSRVAETIPDVLIAAGMSGDEAERIAERVQRAAERAAEKVQRHAERVEHHAVRAERWAERQAARAAARVEFPRPPRPPRRPDAPPAPPVSDEERLSVLRMVEQGKISVDDAERLLAALSGRPS